MRPDTNTVKKISQDDFEKVHFNVIKPLEQLYDTEINTYQAEAMVEELHRYSKPILDAAVKTLRATSKRLPSLAGIVEVCRSVSKTRNPTVPYTEQQKTFPAEAEEFIKGPDGQMALREGFGASAWQHVFDTGDKDLKIKSLSKLRHEYLDAREVAENLHKHAPADEVGRLSRIWDSMRRREADFAKKYLMGGLAQRENVNMPAEIF